MPALPQTWGQVPKVPVTEGLRSSFLSGLLFYYDIYSGQLIAWLSSVPPPDWQFTEKNISEALNEFSRLLLASEVSIRMTLSFQLLKLSPVRCSAYTEREQRDIVPSEFSYFKDSERKLNSVKFSIYIHVYLYFIYYPTSSPVHKPMCQ